MVALCTTCHDTETECYLLRENRPFSEWWYWTTRVRLSVNEWCLMCTDSSGMKAEEVVAALELLPHPEGE